MFNSFPVCRSIFDHWIYTDADYLKIWVTMLGKARYLKDTKIGLHQNIQYTLNYGDFIFGRTQWSKNLNVGEQKIRTCIKKLIADNMIQLVKTTTKFTIFSVTNYEKFNQQDNQQQTQPSQQFQGTTNQQDNQRITNGQPTDNQRITTNKEREEREERKEEVITPKQIEKTPIKKQQSYELMISNYTNNEDFKSAIVGFVEMRKVIKFPMTDNALKLTLNKLDKMANCDNAKIEILEQSTMNSYRGIFPVTNKTPIAVKEKPKSKPITRREDF